jgi:uncharacterized small protein (DUF1192 family)
MDLYQRALARALDRPEADAGIAGEPMMAAVAHSQRVARLEAEIERLRARVESLEALLRDAYYPIDVWGWVEENRALLETIPGWKLPYTDRSDEQKANR